MTAPRKPPIEFRIRLTCGCAIVNRNPPLHARVRFTCVSGLGHGYRLPWVSWTSSAGGAGANPDAKPHPIAAGH